MLYIIIGKYLTQVRQLMSNINKNYIWSIYSQMRHFAKFDGRCKEVWIIARPSRCIYSA